MFPSARLSLASWQLFTFRPWYTNIYVVWYPKKAWYSLLIRKITKIVLNSYLQLLLAAALIALVRAGGPAAYSISSPSGDYASVGSSQEHTVKVSYTDQPMLLLNQSAWSSLIQITKSRNEFITFFYKFNFAHVSPRDCTAQM